MNTGVAKEDVILIVDDTPTNLEVLLDLLEADGFKVVVGEDGESAIALAEYAPPDLILLDLGLPDESGQSVLRKLHGWYTKPIIQNKKQYNNPLVMSTSLCSTEYKIFLNRICFRMLQH